MNTPFQTSAVELTHQIDEAFSRLEGTGRRFWKRAGNIHRLLGASEIHHLRSIAAENHQFVLSDGFTTKGGRREFLDRCRWMVERLEAHLQPCA